MVNHTLPVSATCHKRILGGDVDIPENIASGILELYLSSEKERHDCFEISYKGPKHMLLKRQSLGLGIAITKFPNPTLATITNDSDGDIQIPLQTHAQIPRSVRHLEKSTKKQS